jgi:hypothetical protein
VTKKFFINVGVPDPSLGFKLHFDWAGNGDTWYFSTTVKLIVSIKTLRSDMVQEVKKRAENICSVFARHEHLEYLMLPRCYELCCQEVP